MNAKHKPDAKQKKLKPLSTEREHNIYIYMRVTKSHTHRDATYNKRNCNIDCKFNYTI